MNSHRCKEVAFANDFTIAQKIEGIRSYWELLQQVGLLHGYFPNPSKSYLMVKEKHLENAIETFRGSKVKITSEGKKHLGTAIGSKDFKASYVKSIVDNRIDQLNLVSKIRSLNRSHLIQSLLVDLKENLRTTSEQYHV